MPEALPEPLERLTFDAATLMAEHPPMWRHTNKLVVFTVGCPEGCVHTGTIGYTRWPAFELPASANPAEAVQHAAGGRFAGSGRCHDSPRSAASGRAGSGTQRFEKR